MATLWPPRNCLSWGYNALDNKPPSVNEQKTTVNTDRRLRPIRSHSLEILLGSLILSNLVFAALSGSLFLGKLREDSSSQRRLGSFEKGFKTELAAARAHVMLRPRIFTGGPTFSEDGTEYLRFPPNEPLYIGEPTKEIDDAWTALTAARYIFLTEEEAKEAWGLDYRDFWDPNNEGYIAGLDTFHLLHCLDHIRQSFYPERYTHVGIHGILHRDHCIDSLRQMLQCTSDLTPIPTRFYSGIGYNYIDSDRMHVCRDFGQIRAWVTDRFNGSSAVKVRVDHEHQVL